MHSTPPDATASLRRLSEHVPIDLGLAVEGYLTSPDGRSVRYIHRLDHIAGHVQLFGASLWWDREMRNPVGWCLPIFRTITLAGFLYWEDPEDVRHVLAHECCHLFPEGKSEAFAREATFRIYGDVIRTMVR